MSARRDWLHDDDTKWMFVGQVRLDDVAPLDIHDQLPSEGLMSFFHGMHRDGYDVARVMVTPLSELRAATDLPISKPRGLEGVDLFPRVDPPPYGSRFIDGDRIEESYMRFLHEERPSDETFHGMLGYDKRDNALLETSSVMLLRLDADGEVPFDFIEASAVYFMIREESLRKGMLGDAVLSFGDLG